MNGSLYYTDDYGRRALDVDRYRELYKAIPDAEVDKCPECGHVGADQCRCPVNHRWCQKCRTNWRWEVNKHKGIIEQRM